MEDLEIIRVNDYQKYFFKLTPELIAVLTNDCTEKFQQYISNYSVDTKMYTLKTLIAHNNIEWFMRVLPLYGRLDLTQKNNEFLKIAVVNNSCHILQYLVENGVDITCENNFAINVASGNTNNGSLQTLELLIKLGADVRANNDYPICNACNTNLEMVKILFENGADVHVRNELPFRIATDNLNLDIMQFLVQNGVDVNANKGHALRIAVESGDHSAVGLLLKAGADVNYLDQSHLTSAIQTGSYKIVELLIEHGAKFDVLNNTFTKDYKTKKMVKLLVEQGVNIDTIACIMISVAQYSPT